jgi:hypothetical protein
MNDIYLPAISKLHSLESTFDNLDNLIKNCIIYLCYLIAILCGLKFIVYSLNGFASKQYMGSSSLDDPSFRR